VTCDCQCYATVLLISLARCSVMCYIHFGRTTLMSKWHDSFLYPTA